VETYTVNDYERLSAPLRRRTDKDLIIPRREREDRLLYEWNVSAKDMAVAVATVVRVKNQRQYTAHFVTSGWHKVDALWHSTISSTLSQRAWEQSTRQALALEQQHLAYLHQVQQQQRQANNYDTGPKLDPKDDAFDYASYYLHLYPNLYNGSSVDHGTSDSPLPPCSVDGDQTFEHLAGPRRRHSHTAGPPPPPPPPRNALVGPTKPSLRTSTSPTTAAAAGTSTSTNMNSGRRHTMGISASAPDRGSTNPPSPPPSLRNQAAAQIHGPSPQRCLVSSSSLSLPPLPESGTYSPPSPDTMQKRRPSVSSVCSSFTLSERVQL
jgi:hypothetical protein